MIDNLYHLLTLCLFVSIACMFFYVLGWIHSDRKWIDKAGTGNPVNCRGQKFLVRKWRFKK